MTADVAQLEPQPVWQAFASLLEVPRPSGREERVAAQVREWAARHGLVTHSDAARNLVIDVPASAGAERAATIALQAHLDMVGEKAAGVEHDFTRDPIAAYVDDGWVRARGTTLGADNGIGVAAAMAAATDPTLVHPPLQLVFTVEEETGLRGALELDPALVRAAALVNLDSEHDGEVIIGCTGGARAALRLAVRREAPAAGLQPHEISVGGLRGGHSGVQIHEGLGNAIRVLARILFEARRGAGPIELASLAGGNAHNAIPRDASAIVRTADPAALAGVADEVAAAVRSELHGVDDALAATVRPTAEPAGVLPEADRDRAIDILAALPHGVLAMNRALPGTVETSVNLAVVATTDDEIAIQTLARSSSEPALDGVLASLEAHARLAGGSIEIDSRYPGWDPRPDTRLLRVTRAAYRSVHGTDPTLAAIHGGLECGALARALPDLEMVSIGPDILAPHSPDERVRIESVARFWAVLRELLAALAS